MRRISSSSSLEEGWPLLAWHSPRALRRTPQQQIDAASDSGNGSPSLTYSSDQGCVNPHLQHCAVPRSDLCQQEGVCFRHCGCWRVRCIERPTAKTERLRALESSSSSSSPPLLNFLGPHFCSVESLFKDFFLLLFFCLFPLSSEAAAAGAPSSQYSLSAVKY